MPLRNFASVWPRRATNKAIEMRKSNVEVSLLLRDNIASMFAAITAQALGDQCVGKTFFGTSEDIGV